MHLRSYQLYCNKEHTILNYIAKQLCVGCFKQNK